MTLARAPLAALFLGWGHTAWAQVTDTEIAIADAFVCTGSTNYENGADLTGLNFGGAGMLGIAPASAAKGEFQSLLKFSLSNGAALFNATYGSNNWNIVGLSLELTSDYGVGEVQPNNPIFNVISGGRFVIEWLADDDWVEGSGTPNLPVADGVSVCYNSLPMLLAQPRESLGTNTYTPPGNNVHLIWPLPLTTNLVADVSSGGEVTFHFYAAEDQVSYLFNSYSYGRGNEPLMHVVAAPRLQILSGTFTNGFFRLTAVGGMNLAYQVQANSYPATTNWQTIGTVTADSAGLIQFDDSTAASQPQRFYRLTR